VQLTASGRALAVVAMLLMLGGIAAGGALYVQSHRQTAANREIVEQGVTTVGYVVRLWSNGDDRRRVAYRFSVDGRAFDGRARVSESVRRTLSVGTPVTVRYLANSPRRNDLGGSPPRPIPLPVPFGLGALGLVAGTACLVGLARERRLLVDGLITAGVVTGLETHKGAHGADHRVLRYEFALLSGVKASGKCHTSSTPPAIGTTVWVVYDPDAPGRSRTYPFSLVRVSA
jgi:hypothetical protein